QLREEVIGGNACPLLVAGPSPQFVEPGASFKLTVSAVGVDLSYRWLKSRNLLPIDRPPLVVTDAGAAGAGLYAAIAYKACSSVTSSPVRVLVNSDTDGDGLTDPYEQGFTRYQIIQQNFTPAQARADAEARGGHLATITSQAEWELLRGLSLDLRGALLGGLEESSEGNWRWVTGEPWSFTLWATGEPNDTANRNYIAFSQSGDTWIDVNSTATISKYLLEIGSYSDWRLADTDGDGLNDGDEKKIYHTFPAVADTDGDGLSD